MSDDSLQQGAETWVGRAPGRLDVMGGIADYSGATVLQLPLDRHTRVMLQRQTAPRCDIVSYRGAGRAPSLFAMDVSLLTDGPLREASALANWFAANPEHHWAAYVVGVVQFCLHRARRDGRELPFGLRLRIESSVPEGKGVSSSAALEVAAMAAVAACCDLRLTPEEMALACQWVENHVVRAPCGVMDQMTSACGRRGRLLQLRCQPATIEGYPEIPGGYRFYGIDSGVRHAVTGADYETVRVAAFMGYRIIAEAAGLEAEMTDRITIADPRWHGYLANVSPAELRELSPALPERMRGDAFLSRYGGTTDTATRVRPDRVYPVRRATEHPVNEQTRITRFVTLLPLLAGDAGVARELGSLMYASHESYGACGLGSAATDRLVDLVRAEGHVAGLFGAKITGGGSGGTVAILGRADAESTVREIAHRYARETGRAVEVFAESGPGAAELGVEFRATCDLK